jgi:molecular chaperone HtpG
MSVETVKQEFAFQAEIRQLLHLLSHSLYQSPDIAIRELVSNASDALDKFRHAALTEEGVGDEEALEIRISFDAQAGTVSISDNGVGMTREELVQNLGTIAKSGSLEFLSRLSDDAKRNLSLIGQFGVGFYSAFMLADVVEVQTRSYREETGWIWESEGTGSFSIRPADAPLPRGTTVVLHLKEDRKDYASTDRLKRILKTYSSFIAHPIRLEGETVNTVKPIWVEPKAQVTAEQYTGFYQHLTHRVDEKPAWHLHYSTDSPIQFHALLYCPPTNPERLGFSRIDHGLHLCAKRVLVQNDCRELLPEYLRFLYGVVDSEDLPLNVSRETLQDNAVFQKIRRVLVKKVLERLAELSKESPEKYLEFYAQFGDALKEGVGVDFENKQKIAALLRFHTTAGDALATLDEYTSRCKMGQKHIYYLSGPDLGALSKNPHLEIFKERGIEVLLLPQPIDEWAVGMLGKYNDFEFRSIDAADLDIPKGESKEKPESAAPASGFERVLHLFRVRLGDRVKEVRRSERLVGSPCILVNPDGGMSVQMQKILMLANKEARWTPRILEVNPNAKLIRRLCELSANPQHEDFIGRVGEQLYDNALMREGLLDRPEETATRVQEFLEEAAQARSPIIT